MVEARKQSRIGKFVYLPIGIVTLIIAFITILEMSNQFYGSAAWLRCVIGLIVWAFISFLIFYFGTRFSMLQANREFAEVKKINEPTVTLDEPIITK